MSHALPCRRSASLKSFRIFGATLALCLVWLGLPELSAGRVGRRAWADTPPAGQIGGPGQIGVTGLWRFQPAAPPVSQPVAAPAPTAAAMPANQPGVQCRRAIQAAGHAAGIPDHLMSAIGRVESGRRGPDGQIHPWPWSINAEGVDHIYDTRNEAIASVRALQAQGMRSIDVGCMQVNLLYHPTAFATLEQAFDPAANAAYAARFLVQLYGQTGSWPKATAAYHSANPELGTPYQQKVMAMLDEETRTDNAFPGEGGQGGTPARGPGVGFRPNTGAIMLSNHSETARLLPQANQGAGRGLEAYRAMPVRVAARNTP
jgi:hypothetical protein